MEAWPKRFWDKVQKTDSCWNWTGCILKKGYGQTYNGKQQYAHRAAYELVKGPIPSGLVIDHLCFNRRCVNPDHLEPKTVYENSCRVNPALNRPRVSDGKEPPHGTFSRYCWKGCRCILCKEANALYQRAYQERTRWIKKKRESVKQKQAARKSSVRAMP